MKFKKYFWEALKTKAEREAYCSRVGFSFNYMRIHLVPKSGIPDSQPPLKKLEVMADASNDAVSFPEMIEHFLDKKKRA